MRHTALLALTLLLPGCQYAGKYAGNPTIGFGGFVGDTHGISANPNAPKAQSENEKYVVGEPVSAAPLLAESGQIWPGPPPPIPTLQDVQRLTPNETLPPPNLGPVPPAVFPQNGASTP